MSLLKNHALTITATLTTASLPLHAAAEAYIDLGGPATGFLAVSNLKNSSTQNGIEGKDSSGNFNPSHNGLPDYPNFQIPAGFTNGGVWTAIVASPQSTANDYQTFIDTFYPNETVAINNQVITQSDASTLSAGRIDFDDSTLINGTGVVPISNITFNLNTLEWDGSLNGDGGSEGQPTPGPNADNPNTVNLPGGASSIQISPFSPVQTIYNDSNGFGNAAIFYEISVTPTGGTGLTFLDGDLIEMDITGDLIVGLKLGQATAFPPVLFGEGEDSNPAGTFTASGTALTGLDYEFSLQDTESAVIFSGINMLFNRSGTATLVPEPASLMLLGVGGMILLNRRRQQS